jgi:hypothetical protein
MGLQPVEYSEVDVFPGSSRGLLSRVNPASKSLRYFAAREGKNLGRLLLGFLSSETRGTPQVAFIVGTAVQRSSAQKVVTDGKRHFCTRTTSRASPSAKDCRQV